MKCYICGEGMKDRGPNRKKVGGRWVHKICPVEAQRRSERAEKKQKQA